MDGESVAHWRMHNLRLSGEPFEGPESVVRWLGAVQSQDYGPAKWSVGQRARGVGDTAMDQAFADGAVLRTHVLRPTWHFVLPSDIRWMLELTAPRVYALSAYYSRLRGLDNALQDKCDALLVSALRGGNHLTRKEVAAVFERDGIAADAPRLGHILMNAELNGVVCSGPPRGKQHTYALLEERAPQARSLGRDEALAELALRYFTSHGPATVKDFKWWSSLTTADITSGLGMVGSRLDREVIDGVTYWFADPAPPARPESSTVHLLQAYDEYVVGYTESKYVLDVSGAARSVPRGRTVFNSLVILDGQVAGHWKRAVRKDSVAVEVALYAPFDDAQTEALRAAASRYGEFLGVPATVTAAG
ncbi:MAG TPA: winged helix DNA-binding domain-containing protein [Planosporangium sp.]|nr:winged helix DNA-binding domain-containing protein [Planosporangium sp.]